MSNDYIGFVVYFQTTADSTYQWEVSPKPKPTSRISNDSELLYFFQNGYDQVKDPRGRVNLILQAFRAESQGSKTGSFGTVATPEVQRSLLLFLQALTAYEQLRIFRVTFADFEELDLKEQWNMTVPIWFPGQPVTFAFLDCTIKHWDNIVYFCDTSETFDHIIFANVKFLDPVTIIPGRSNHHYLIIGYNHEVLEEMYMKVLANRNLENVNLTVLLRFENLKQVTLDDLKRVATNCAQAIEISRSKHGKLPSYIGLLYAEDPKIKDKIWDKHVVACMLRDVLGRKRIYAAANPTLQELACGNHARLDHGVRF